jgi:hypothetical protein
MSDKPSFFAELKRSNVYKVAVERKRWLESESAR